MLAHVSSHHWPSLPPPLLYGCLRAKHERTEGEKKKHNGRRDFHILPIRSSISPFRSQDEQAHPGALSVPWSPFPVYSRLQPMHSGEEQGGKERRMVNLSPAWLFFKLQSFSVLPLPFTFQSSNICWEYFAQTL